MFDFSFHSLVHEKAKRHEWNCPRALSTDGTIFHRQVVVVEDANHLFVTIWVQVKVKYEVAGADVMMTDALFPKDTMACCRSQWRIKRLKRKDTCTPPL